tara:strand:- start:107640 stop:108419 length:780 start_codon:yes stop_codon:yes gene_type:complete
MRAHVIGDLHGYYQPYRDLLIQNHLMNEDEQWLGGTDQLWLIGDIFDRGTEAVACIDLTLKLAEQAAATGGVVDCILGNHEMMFLAAHRFMDHPDHGPRLWQQWVRWGGQEIEMGHITAKHITWLTSRPAMVLVGDRLFIHSDNVSYVNYGFSIEQVNQYFQNLIQSEDVDRWFNMLPEFSQRGGFESSITGQKQAAQLLKMYGGNVLVHGHTPISQTVDVRAEDVTSARVYADGVCCNVDGGIYLGGPGFVYSFDISA